MRCCSSIIVVYASGYFGFSVACASVVFGAVSASLVGTFGYKIEYSFYIFSCHSGNEVKKTQILFEQEHWRLKGMEIFVEVNW